MPSGSACSSTETKMINRSDVTHISCLFFLFSFGFNNTSKINKISKNALHRLHHMFSICGKKLMIRYLTETVWSITVSSKAPIIVGIVFNQNTGMEVNKTAAVNKVNCKLTKYSSNITWQLCGALVALYPSADKPHPHHNLPSTEALSLVFKDGSRQSSLVTPGAKNMTSSLNLQLEVKCCIMIGHSELKWQLLFNMIMWQFSLTSGWCGAFYLPRVNMHHGVFSLCLGLLDVLY